MPVRLPSRPLRQRLALLVAPTRLPQAVRWLQPRRVRCQAARCEQGGSGTGTGDRGIRRPEIAIAIYYVGMDVMKAIPPDEDFRLEEGRIADSDEEFLSGLLTNIPIGPARGLPERIGLRNTT